MKKQLLDLLCCPDCRQEKFDLRICGGGGDGKREILEGEIRCLGCGSRFPVINRIPRMLPASLRRSLVEFHHDFFERHPDLVPENAAEKPDKKVARTLEGYSYLRHAIVSNYFQEVKRRKRYNGGSIIVSDMRKRKHRQLYSLLQYLG
jgi:uncharacterized protein YbaR (Trm112 family)